MTIQHRHVGIDEATTKPDIGYISPQEYLGDYWLFIMTLVVKAIYVENDIGCEIMGQRSNECNILNFTELQEVSFQHDI